MPPAIEAPDEPIAIIGYSCILPGGQNVNESWETIKAGLNCISDLPADRVDVESYFDPNKTTPDKIYCTRGGFIPNFDFEPSKYNLNMNQMEDTDTNQTLSLIKVKEALESAQINPSGSVRKNIGCVLGNVGGSKASHEFYSRLNYVVVEKVLRGMGATEEDVQVAVAKYKAHFPEWRLDSFPGFLGNVMAGRCANVFNLDGMNCVVDAACASSLIAVKVAIDELLRGDCETMIAGATCSDCSLAMYMAFSKTPVFSTKQGLSAYDKDSKGMLIGEGSVVYVLKKLSTARRDGDQVHAVIRACASSSDGKAPGIYAPTIEGQEQCIRRAYEHAGIDPTSVTLVEGHGTGTPVGDAIELTALKNVMGEGDARRRDPRRERCAVGSIKSQIGHLKAVAGAAGMLKVVLALKHKVLPATINVQEPPELRDHTRVQDSALYLNTRTRPWFAPPGVPRRAGVSSFGFGGANYHAVLEEYEPEHTKPYRMHAVPDSFLLAAPDAAQLLCVCEAAHAALAAAQQARGASAKPEDARSHEALLQHHAYAQLVAAHAVRRGVPADHARVGFVAAGAAAALAALAAVVERLRRDGAAASWRLPLPEGANQAPRGHMAHFRASAVAGTAEGGGVAALFAADGAQYAHMYEEAAMHWPPIRAAISAADAAPTRVAAAPPDAPPVSRVLYPREHYPSEPEPEARPFSELHAQLATAAVGVGAFDVFKQAGLAPGFVAAQARAELPALYAAGALDANTALELTCQQAAAPDGLAASVRAAAAAFKPPTAKVYAAGTGARAYAGGAAEAAELLAAAAGAAAGGGVAAQVHAMHADGARVFVDFGPTGALAKLARAALPPSVEDDCVVAVNGSRVTSSDAQLREAAVQLGVLGVPLDRFDPWGVPNPFRPSAADPPPVPKKKSVLSLSASTFVSPRTIKSREAAMADGKRLSGQVLAPGDVGVPPTPSLWDVRQLEQAHEGQAKAEAAAAAAAAEAAQCRAAAADAAAEAEMLRAKLARAEAALEAARAAPPQSRPHTAAPAAPAVSAEAVWAAAGWAGEAGAASAAAQQKETAAAAGGGATVSGYDVGGLYLSGPNAGYRSELPPAQFMEWGKPTVGGHALSWHPLAGKNGNPTPGFRATPYPPRPIAFVPFPGSPHDNNHTPGVLPLSWVNMCEFMCNNVSQCLGDDFKGFDESSTSRSPAFDLALTTRVLSVTGMEEMAAPAPLGQGKWYGVDRNPATGTMVAEFDCPADAWFFAGAPRGDLMPYSILMEIALQTCGILTSWNKAPLTLAVKEGFNLLFRNLDATATLLRAVELRGQTIQNVSTCTGYSMLGQMGVQKFHTVLSVGGEPFYEVDSSFGWFLPAVFEKQVGLDGGKKRDCWHVGAGHALDSFALPADEARIFAPLRGPHRLSRRSGQARYLDGVGLSKTGGKHGHGYGHGFKTVDKRDWFFSCHFWCDSVMPGSLGVEAMHQTLELWCVHAGLGGGKRDATFSHELGKTAWKYRGQLTPKAERCDVEVHVKSVEKAVGSVTVVADGFLYVDALRVYEVNGLRLRIHSEGK